jgi:hypothetical protein
MSRAAKEHPEETAMVTAKKCYNCMTEVEEDAKVCPRCRAKLGDRTESGIAAKPGSPVLKILLVFAALALIGKLAVHSNTGAAPANTLVISTTTGADPAREAAIQKIKEKGAKDLSTVGVADVGYKGDTLRVYVDQRFSSLSSEQQRQVLSIVAVEWESAIGKTSTAVTLLEYGTEKTIAEMVV